MIDTETAYMIIIGLLAIHLFFFMGFQYQLLQILDELAFPSDDPIMTSTLEEPNNPDIFEYEENTTVLEEEPEVFEYAEPKDIEQWDNEEPEVLEVPEEVPEEPEPEIFTEGLETRRTISFFEPDFPPLTLAQLKRLPKAELIELCEKYGHATDGTKNDLFKRLVD